jgi:hypothetical protein
MEHEKARCDRLVLKSLGTAAYRPGVEDSKSQNRPASRIRPTDPCREIQTCALTNPCVGIAPSILIQARVITTCPGYGTMVMYEYVPGDLTLKILLILPTECIYMCLALNHNKQRLFS